MLGKAAVAMWWDVAPEMRAEWEDWHSHEHMPERLAIPGFLRGTRWSAFSGAPSYFTLYEAVKLATITAGAYLKRLNHPTPWSRKMMPHHLNVVRSLCRVRASFGGGLAHTVATIRFSPAPRAAASLSNWLATDALPALPERKGLAAVSLLESQPTAGVAQTTEQQIRGKDTAADWILLICGYQAEAVQALAADEFGVNALAAHGAVNGGVRGLYRVAYSLTPKDLP